jgi:hypothetical protein
MGEYLLMTKPVRTSGTNFIARNFVRCFMNLATRKGRRLLYGLIALVLLIAGGAGYRTLNGASSDVDPSKLATAEMGTMVRSVVAIGKVEPITKVEIKSKANGIIQRLPVDIDGVVKEGDVLAELDRELLAATLRGAEANLMAATAALEAAEAQFKKNVVEAEGLHRIGEQAVRGSTLLIAVLGEAALLWIGAARAHRDQLGPRLPRLPLRQAEWTGGKNPARVTYDETAADAPPAGLTLATLDGKLEVVVRYRNPRMNSGFDPTLLGLTVPEHVRIQDFR